MTLSPAHLEIRKRIYFIAVALAIHLIAFSLLTKRIRHQDPPHRRDSPIAIEIRETKLGTSTQHPTSYSHHGHRLHLQPTFSISRGAKSDANEDSSGWSEETWGARGGNFGEVVNLSKYERLMSEVEGLLFYPGRLAQHNISGVVKTRLSFNHQSECNWSRSRVEGGHPYLQVYVLALLKKLCAFENIKRIKFSDGQFVDLSFAFLPTRQPETEAEQSSHDQIVGNVISFYRSYLHSELEYNIGPLHGYLFAPVVTLNFPWIFEHWETYVDGKDPLQEYKEGH